MIPQAIKNLFKRNLAVSDMWLSKTGQPIYTNWTVKKAVAEGYKINGWVYRSVFLIAKAAAQVTFYAADKETNEKINEHHLTTLLRKPNPNISRQDMTELMVDWLELAGNSYLKKVKAGKETQELWPVSPDRIAPVASKKVDEWIQGYALDASSNPTFQPEEIIHHKFMDPSNPLIGIAPLQAAGRTVDVDNAQQNFNIAAMQNRGVIDGVMTFKREFQSQEEVDKVSERLNESAGGEANARKIKVVGSEASYKRMALTPVEMDFTESGKANMSKIFIVFGIPPAYGGSEEASTYNNFAASELIFWFQTIIPLLDDLADTYTMSFSDELKDNQKISYSLIDIPAIMTAMGEKAKTAKQLFEMGVPFEQLNTVFKLGFDSFSDWEKSYVKTGNVNISSGDQSRKAKYTLLETREVNKTEAKIQKVAEGPVKDMFSNLLKREQEEMFKNLTVANIRKINAKYQKFWETDLAKVYLDVGNDFGSNTVVEARAIEPELNQAIIEYLEEEAVILSEASFIADTTLQQVLTHVVDGTRDGATTAQIQQAIIDSGTFSPERALRIARTETGTAANLGQWKSAELSGATHKTWLNSGFDVRDTHIAVNGDKVKIDENYTVGGESARYPLDNRLSPAEKVNCRCTQFYSVEG